MRVVFICSALEAGKDGIGDYTRNLAQECFLNGLSPIIIAVNDEYISAPVSGKIYEIQFYRFPKKMLWKEKGDELLKILNANEPVDWISMQFQPFGFSNKGIIGDAAPFFYRLKPWKLHFMMHELWVAEEREAPLKMKILGWLQKRSILSLLNKIQPRVIQTSIPLYNKILNLAGIKSSILPLFSNVQYRTEEDGLYRELIPEILQKRNDYFIACLFGSIYNDSWDLSSLFTILKQEKVSIGKQIMIVSIGKISFGKEFWNGLSAQYPDINFLTLGPQEEGFISYWLNNYVDLGIVTTPAVIAGKSGSCMAFLEHGIPVVCKRNDLSFNFKIDETLIDERVIQISETNKFNFPKRIAPAEQLKNTGRQFIQTLNGFK